jgi:hypothetical protein
LRVFEKARPSLYRNFRHRRQLASEASFPEVYYREKYGLRVKNPAPKFPEIWQRKNPKTYAQIGCEQVVGKFALKWFFGSQLLRASPILNRLRIVLSHVA